MRTLLLVVLIIYLPGILSADELETARKATGTSIVKCSPDGENGGLIPLKALASLKKGMTLMLLPGNYDSEIIVATDKIILTSDQTGKCHASVQIKAKDCIVKDIWIHSINADGDVIVVDSILDTFYSGDQERKKLSHSLYNTCLGQIRCGYTDTKLKLQNCTVVSNQDALDCEQFSKWTIENCILFSNQAVFRFDGYGNKKCKMSLRDNLIFGKTGIGKKEYTNSKSELPQALNLKDLKRMGSITLLGTNTVEQPEFVTKLEPVEVEVIGIRDRGMRRMEVMDQLKPDNFRLKPGSPGEGKGVNFAENPYFKENAPKAATPTPPKELTPEEQNKKNAWNKEWERIAEEAKNKKDKPKPPAENDNDNELGGVPDQPE